MVLPSALPLWQMMPAATADRMSLRPHILSDRPSASYSLCAVSNHFGTLSGGHYTSYCRSSHENVWYNCNARSVGRLRTPVEISAAYLLFFNSLQNMWVLLLVPMVLLLLWCEAWCGLGTAWFLWMGGCWVGGDGGLMPCLWWGWWMAVLRQTNVGCRVLWSFPCTSRTPSVPVFPISIGPFVFLPYFPYPFVPLISQNNDTRVPTAWCWELLFCIAPSGQVLISPLKCFWPVCWTVSGQASGLVRSMTYVAFSWLWELSRDLPR